MKKSKRPVGEDLFRATMQADIILKSSSRYLECDRNLATQYLRLFKAMSELCEDDCFRLLDISKKGEETITEMESARIIRKKYKRRMRK